MCKRFLKNRIKFINLSKLRIKHKLFAFLFAFLVFVILYFKYLVFPVVIRNTESQIKSFATKSINYAVADTMNQGVGYGDLINIVKDKNDNISFVQRIKDFFNKIKKDYAE